MRPDRSIANTLAAASSAVLGVLVAALLAGCGGAGGGGTTSAAASPDPAAKEALGAAVTALSGASYTYTMKIDEGTVTGAVDPAGRRRARLDAVASGVPFALEGIVLGGERYFRTSIPASGVNAKKWYRLDRTKVTKDEIIGLFETTDPTSSRDLVGRVSSATRQSPARISGTYDLTRGGDLGVGDRAALAALGERARTAPFVATLDAQQHLESIRITVPAYGSTAERTLSVDYQGQGRPIAVAAPKAGEVTAATSAVYNLLNN
jgi:hypothetical protein